MIEALKDQTYMVRHSPNCPKRFEVRLSGLALLVEWSRIGSRHLPNMRDGDDIGYGDTVEEAAANALAAKETRLAELHTWLRSTPPVTRQERLGAHNAQD